MKKTNQKEINNSIELFLKHGRVFEQYSRVIEFYLKKGIAYVVGADLLRHSEIENLSKHFPDTVINLGIAEQNLLGFSAGLSSYNKQKIVFTQTLAAFLINRGLDIIGQNICNDKLNVKLLGSASGLATGIAGISHWMINDLGMLRALPNLTILCPSDVFEVAKCVDYAALINGPVYIRMPIPYFRKQEYINSECITDKGFYSFGDNSKKVIITYGAQVDVCKEIIHSEKADVSLIELYCVNRFDTEGFFRKIRDTQKIMIIEEHVSAGSVGEMLLKMMIEKNVPSKVKCLCLPDLITASGDYNHLLKNAKLDHDSIQENIKEYFMEE